MSLGPGDSEPSQLRGGNAAKFPSLVPARNSSPTTANPITSSQVTFDRSELNRLFGLYGRKVAAGEWRDYAIDGLSESAVFSIYKRSSEAPLYRIEKRPALARRQGAWAVLGQGGMVLRRGHELEQVLRFFDRGRFKVVD